MNGQQERLPVPSARLQSAIIVGAVISLGVLLSLRLGLVAWILIAMGFAGVALFAYPPALAAVLMGWSVLSPILLANFRSGVLELVDEALLVFLGAFLAASVLIQKERKLVPGKGAVAFAALLGITLVSAYVNNVPWVIVLRFVTTYFGCFVVFFFAMSFFPNSAARTFLVGMIAVFVLQFVLNVTWWFGVNPLPNRMYGTIDFARGTLEGCNYVGYYMCAAVFLILAWWRQTGRVGKTPLAGLLMAVTLFSLHLTRTEHAVLMLPFFVAGQFVLTRKTWRPKLAAVGLGLAVLVGLVSLNRHLRYEHSHELLSIMSMRNLVYRARLMTDGVKGQAHKDVLINSRYLLRVPFLGAGPGNFASITARNLRRPLAEHYINYVTYSYRGMEISQHRSITGMPETGMLAIYSELGPLGLLLFAGLHVYALFRVARQVRGNRYRALHRRVLAEAFVPLMAFWIVLNALGDFFFLDSLQYGIWIWCACVWNGDAADAAAPPVAEARA